MREILEGLIIFIKDIISTIGYPGIFACMVVEGILTPIPSEIIIPFAGFLAFEGVFYLPFVILVGALGSTVGSTGAYYIGLHLGRPFVLKYGKYFGIKEKHIDWAEGWFTKYGDKAIFIGHSLPGTRSFISFPAGIAKMKLKTFMIFTFLGALIWTTILGVAGYLLGSQWENIISAVEYLDIIIIAVVIAAIIIYIWWVRRQA